MKSRAIVITLFLLVGPLSACSKRSDSPTGSSAPAKEEANGKEASVAFHNPDLPNAEVHLAQTSRVRIVEGKILGLIVQKETVLDGESKGKSSRKAYSARYWVTKGEEVAAFDGDGLHKAGSADEMVSVHQQNAPLDDAEVVQVALAIPETELLNPRQNLTLKHRTKAGGTVLRTRVTSFFGPVTTPFPLLGEFREDETTKKPALIPAIRISTANGVITVPIEKMNASLPSSTLTVGTTVEINDVGKNAYTTINESDCLKWPSPEIKAKGGESGWGSFYPKNGSKGVIVDVTRHCMAAGTTVYIVKIEDYYVATGYRGVRATQP